MITTAVAMDERPGAKTVLVCHDERHITRLLQANLERQGHKVDSLHNGQEAIEILESAEVLNLRPFDKVVLNLMLPKVNGYEVLKWIRTHEWSRDTWVGMMIPSDQDPEYWESQPYKADMYFTKPFNPLSLF